MLESTTADANSNATPVAVEERSATKILDGQSFNLAKRRASKACQRCRAHKIRCDFTERSDACKNCIGVVECVFIESKRRKRPLGTEVGNTGPPDADSAVREGGGLPQEKIREREGHYARRGGLVERQGRLEMRREGFEERERRPGAGLLCPSSSPSSSDTHRVSAVPQHHARLSGFVKPSSTKMPSEGLVSPAVKGVLTSSGEPLWSNPENSSLRWNRFMQGALVAPGVGVGSEVRDIPVPALNGPSINMGSEEQDSAFWSSEERRCQAELRRVEVLANLRIREAELSLAIRRYRSAQQLTKELDMGSVDMPDAPKAVGENELQLKLEPLLHLPPSPQRGDAVFLQSKFPSNSASPSAISSSGTQQVREELPSLAECPTPPDLPDLSKSQMAPEGGNNGALDTPPWPLYGQYDNIGHHSDASLLVQERLDGSSCGFGLPGVGDSIALPGEEEMMYLGTDDFPQVLGTWTGSR